MSESFGVERRHTDFANVTPELTVLSDLSLESGASHLDNFDLQRRVGPIYDIIRHPKTRTPMTIAIFGDWGSGKTSAMRWLVGLLEKWKEGGANLNDGITVEVVWFDPWKYDNKEDVWRGLLAEVILASLGSDKKAADRARRAATEFGAFLGWGFLNCIAIRFPSVVDDLRKTVAEHSAPENAFLNEFENTMRQWVDRTVGPDNRMVIFIDDLDRCMPDVALQVLEALKLYLGLERLIFVVGVDRGVINDLVEQHYMSQGLAIEKSRFYLDKMFQVEVTLASTEQQIEEFLTLQLEELPPWQFLRPEEQELFGRLVLKLANRNPREVKRLLNSAIVDGYGDIIEVRGQEGSGTLNMVDRRKALNQGLQRFFLRRLLRDKGRASYLYQSIGQRFFHELSMIVSSSRSNRNLLKIVRAGTPTGSRSSSVSLVEATPQYDKDALERDADEFVDFVDKWWRTSGAEPLIELMEDEDFYSLMRIEYPEPTAKPIAASVDVQEDAIEDAIRRALNRVSARLSDHDYASVERLDLSGLDICELDPLTKLTNLTGLSLEETQVSDLTPLASLTNLVTLRLGGTKVNDLAPLASLTNLVTLRLEGTQVCDLMPLASLTELRSLWLEDTPVSLLQAESLKKALPKARLYPRKYLAKLEKAEAASASRQT